jgi:carbon monoxide dehydrogenase subunit G
VAVVHAAEPGHPTVPNLEDEAVPHPVATVDTGPARTLEVAVRLEVEQVVAAPRAVVWQVLTDWERQPEWMRDAKEVHVLTPERTGEGVTLRCPTNLLGLTVQDVMRVTTWDAPRELGVTHLGRIITGTGAFVLDEVDAQRTRVRWWEEIDPPLGALGEWGANTLVLPVLRRIFSGSLRALADVAEREARAATA